MSLEFKIIEKDTEENRLLYDFFQSPVGTQLMETGKEKFVCYENFVKGYSLLNMFEVRDDDVFVIGHMKTGTTWLKEMVCLLLKNLDYEQSKTFIEQHFMNLETFTLLSDRVDVFKENTFSLLHEMASPRCIGSHLSWSLLPEQIRNSNKKPKIIYIYRNPMDTCCSYYNFYNMLRGNTANFENFCKLFMEGKMPMGPYMENVLSYWNERERRNLLIINYKDMKKDLAPVIDKVAKFLDKTFTDDQITQLTKHLSFEKTKQRFDKDIQKALEPIMKSHGNTDRTLSFYKSGEEGAYKSKMSLALIKEFDAWIQESLAGTELTF